MSSTTKSSHRNSIFSHPSLNTSSSSINSQSPSNFRLTYAKDGRGHDFSSSYPYTTSLSSSASSMESTSRPQDFQGLRYAKDGKGHNFVESYPYASDASSEANTSGNQQVNRYAKDGKGYNFVASYPYAMRN